MLKLLGALILFTLASAAPGQVYKWVDAKGVTQYSEKPPADGKSKTVDVRESSPRPAGATASASSLKDRELDFRKRQTAREESEARAAQEKTRRDAGCKKARAELINLQNTSRLYQLNERGERIFMSSTERDASVARYEADVNRYCSGS